MRRRKLRPRATIVLLALLLVSCSGEEVVPVAQSGGGTFNLPMSDDFEMARLQGLEIAPPPTLTILSPAPGQLFKPGDMIAIQYEIRNYSVGKPEPGHYVHILVDNRAYRADYDFEGSTTFAATELEPGPHTLFAFLARRFQLSLKNPEAFSMVRFYVYTDDEEHQDLHRTAGVTAEMEQVTMEDLPPTLIYSRPEGTYTQADGAAENIMLDFYLYNCQLDEHGYRVRVTVNERDPLCLDQWKPVILLEDPDPGDYRVTLELVDVEGNLVPGPFNRTTRTITIE